MYYPPRSPKPSPPAVRLPSIRAVFPNVDFSPPQSHPHNSETLLGSSAVTGPSNAAAYPQMPMSASHPQAYADRALPPRTPRPPQYSTHSPNNPIDMQGPPRGAFYGPVPTAVEAGFSPAFKVNMSSPSSSAASSSTPQAPHYAVLSFPSPSPLSSEQRANRYPCPTCSKLFDRPSSLKTHMNTHTGEMPFRCPWPDCGREFNVHSNMRRHYRKHE